MHWCDTNCEQSHFTRTGILFLYNLWCGDEYTDASQFVLNIKHPVNTYFKNIYLSKYSNEKNILMTENI